MDRKFAAEQLLLKTYLTNWSEKAPGLVPGDESDHYHRPTHPLPKATGLS